MKQILAAILLVLMFVTSSLYVVNAQSALSPTTPAGEVITMPPTSGSTTPIIINLPANDAISPAILVIFLGVILGVVIVMIMRGNNASQSLRWGLGQVGSNVMIQDQIEKTLNRSGAKNAVVITLPFLFALASATKEDAFSMLHEIGLAVTDGKPNEPLDFSNAD
ncbi:MAG: hypothetical protein OHK0046_47930 [Anaerolineae bacterium]